MSSANRLNFRAPVLTRRAVCLGLGATLLSSAAPSAHAAGWPSRSVTVVVPYAPGGNTDMMARLASQYLADKLGQPFVVENRAGGGGSVGAVAVAKAQPDGYTLLFGASTQIINIPMLQKVSYDPQKELVPISIFGAGPYLLGVKASLPVNTLAEFIGHVKANPGKLNFATAGVGGNIHLNTALFVARAGLDMVAVPYKSGAPAMGALAAGEVEMYFGNASEVMGHTETRLSKFSRSRPCSGCRSCRTCRRWRRLIRASTHRHGTASSRPPARRRRSSTCSPARRSPRRSSRPLSIAWASSRSCRSARRRANSGVTRSRGWPIVRLKAAGLPIIE